MHNFKCLHINNCKERNNVHSKYKTLTLLCYKSTLGKAVIFHIHLKKKDYLKEKICENSW